MAGSTVHTDESAIYRRVGGLLYKHETINHGVGEYRRGDVTTNGIESVFAVLKRGLHGVYHHASPKHLSRYVNEFAFRLNDGDVKRHTLERLHSFILASAGKRITYREVGSMSGPVKPPAALDAIADKVLRYRPKPTSDAAKKRKRKARKVKKDG